jgi:hypothetical protein
MTGRTARAWLLGTCALALWLRVVGLGFGLPAVYNMDEVAIMNRALAFATGDLNPHNFLYPTLYFYALFVWEGLAFAAGWVAGLFDSIAAFQREFFVDPSRIYLVGRALTALCGVLTVAAVFRLGARLFGTTVGAIAALFLATAPYAVRDGHYVKHDVPVTLLIVLVHVALATLVVTPARQRTSRAWLVVGALAGLAMSTHYYAVFVALPIAAIALLGPRDGAADPTSGRLGRLAIAGAAAAVAFVVASPFLLADPASTLRDITQNRQIVMDRAVGEIGMFPSLGAYLRMLWVEAAGWPVAAASVAGLAIAVVADARRGSLVAIFPVAFLLFIANTVPAGRYLNPVLPFVALAAAVAVVRLAAFAGTALAPRGRGPVLAAMAFGLTAALPGALLSYRTGVFFRQADTRTLALGFIEREVPSGESVLVQPYSVPLRQSRDGLIEALRQTRGTEEGASPKFRHQLDLNPYPSPAYRTIYLGEGGLDADKIYVSPRGFDGETGLDPLRRLGVRWAVFKRFPDADPSLAAFDRALARDARLVATFSPYRSGVAPAETAMVAPFLHNTDARLHPALARPGPTIEVWRIQ